MLVGDVCLISRLSVGDLDDVCVPSTAKRLLPWENSRDHRDMRVGVITVIKGSLWMGKTRAARTGLAQKMNSMRNAGSRCSFTFFFPFFFFQRDVWPLASRPAAGCWRALPSLGPSGGPFKDLDLHTFIQMNLYVDDIGMLGSLPGGAAIAAVLGVSSGRRCRYGDGVSSWFIESRGMTQNWMVPVVKRLWKVSWRCNTSVVSDDLAIPTPWNSLLIPSILVKGFFLSIVLFSFVWLRSW